MSDTQWDVYEVFHQSTRGEPHVHVGSVHASDGQMALLMAREQFARRLTCASLWVVRADHVIATDYQDESFFAQNTDKTYREPRGFVGPLKGKANAD